MGAASGAKLHAEEDLADPLGLPETEKKTETEEPATEDASAQNAEPETTAAAALDGGTESSKSLQNSASWLPLPSLSLWSSQAQEAPAVDTTPLPDSSPDTADSVPPDGDEIPVEIKVKDAEETAWSLSFLPGLPGLGLIGDQDAGEQKVEADASTADTSADTTSSPVMDSTLISDWSPADWAPPTASEEDTTGLLRKGEIEMPEGYLGWWTPCQMELWAGHLLVRSAAQPAQQESNAEGTPQAEDSCNFDSNVVTVRNDDEKACDGEGNDKKDEANKENTGEDTIKMDDNTIRLRLLLEPLRFEQVSLLPDNCFDVLCEQQHYLFRCKVEQEARDWAGHIHWAASNVKQNCSEMQWAYVYLNVYDLAQDWRVGLLNRVSQDLLNVGGAFHAGVEVYGREYTFGCGGDFDDDDDMFANCYPFETGLSQCAPRECDRHTFRQSEILGLTTLAHADVIALLLQLAHEWPARSYRLLERNCVNFCRVFCERLGCHNFPDWVDSLCRTAAERTVIQPATIPAPMVTTDLELVEAGYERDDAGLNTDADGALQQEVLCFWKHPCVLQAQGFMAGFVEYIICECCDRELSRGEAYWHCRPCDFDLCVPCADKRNLCIRQASENGMFTHSFALSEA
mmetsp:Transcript_45284/g.80374  ORF Transcript_45284/g.80374 Transcript_45284/m.80374 type:complete len:629 (+) Transcript_45284:63-1949(+)